VILGDCPKPRCRNLSRSSVLTGEGLWSVWIPTAGRRAWTDAIVCGGGFVRPWEAATLKTRPPPSPLRHPEADRGWRLTAGASPGVPPEPAPVRLAGLLPGDLLQQVRQGSNHAHQAVAEGARRHAAPRHGEAAQVQPLQGSRFTRLPLRQPSPTVMDSPPADWALEVVPPSNWKEWRGQEATVHSGLAALR
jgi:hypothetical protein